MITAKEAAIRSKKYFLDLTDGGPVDLKLEEIQREGKFWLITLSYPSQGSLTPWKKEYKVFKVNGTTGEVVSMKIHTVSEPSIA